MIGLTDGRHFACVDLDRTGASLGWKDCKTISVEAGIQNATLAIALGTVITGPADGFTAMELPPAVYGITMNFVALPFVLYYRSRP